MPAGGGRSTPGRLLVSSDPGPGERAAGVAIGGEIRLEVLPLRLDFCFTRLADAGEFDWIERRLARACAALGDLTISWEANRLVIRR